MKSAASMLRAALDEPLVTARRLLGAAAVLKAAVVAPVLLELSRPDALRFPLADWTPVWSGPVLQFLLVVWVLAALAFLFGWRTRWSGIVLTVIVAAVLVGDEQLYSNHLYLLLTLVGLTTLAEGRWIARPVMLLRLQATIVYGFAAVTKLNFDFMSGAVLNVYMGHGSLLPVPENLRTAGVMSSLALTSIVIEGLLAVGLWSPRWRQSTIALGVAFHIGIILLLDTPLDLTVFALLMFGLYILHAADASDTPAA